MKKIDKLLISSFVTPFVATFFIAMFVLIMQFLWVYIDDIIGKGVGLMMITELMFYSSMSLIPTALPIAVLISSVMVFGNLAEHYELSSFKSAGVPLLRIMAPLFLLTIGIAVFSYFCSNNLVPVTNLKFKSRLYDIRKSKATLSLDEGIFNEDFKGFVIHIGKKERDGKTIRDVIIYNHDYKYKNRLSIITAKTGEMFNSDDKRYFIMNLYDGVQYQEPEPGKGKDGNDSTFSRTYFKEWNKVFDLSEFDVQETDQDRFKNNYSMLTYNQLLTAIDSLDVKIDNRYITLGNHLKRHFQPTKKLIEKAKTRTADNLTADANAANENDSKEDSPEDNKSATYQNNNTPTETAITEDEQNEKQKTKIFNKKKKQLEEEQKIKEELETTLEEETKKALAAEKEKIEQEKKEKEVKEKARKAAEVAKKKRAEKAKSTQNKGKKTATKKKKKKVAVVQVDLDKPIEEYDSFFQTLAPDKHKRYINKTKSFARGIRDQAEGALTSLSYTKEIRVKHIYELNIKFSMAVVCIIFLFIGGPMGAIIRKGGFGYPILVAIFFFVIFMILNIFFKKLAESFVIAAEYAPWMPCIILIPVGIFLTHRAMNDMKMINTDRLQKIFDFLKKRFSKKEKQLNKTDLPHG